MKSINDLIDRISERKWVFLIVFLFLTLDYLFPLILTSNEAVTLTYAKHLMNKDWIPNDFFFNQNPGYTLLFSVIAGSLARILPLTVVSMIIRILAIVGFSYLSMRISETFNVKVFVIVIFMYAYLRNQSIVAGEWMLILSESKTFAYLFALLALISFIQKEYSRTFIFLGLSVSFHVLIGIYASFSMVMMYLMNISHLKGEFRQLLKKFYLYFIFGSLGIFAVVQNLFTKYEIDRVQIGRIAVTIREAHHQLPSAWTSRTWILKLLLCLTILSFTFFIVKDRKHKLISSFGLSSFVYFIIGLILFWTKKWHVLKYFWFRFPDTILPYISFFLFFSLLYDLLGKIEFIRNRALLKKSVPVVFLLTSIVVIGLSTGKFIGSVKPIIADTEYFYLKDTEVEMKEVMLWIRNSTDAASVFLVNPFIDNFYVGAERGAFVILKAGPLTEEKYAEWYERVKLCNGNKELTQYGWDNKSEIDTHFYALSEEELHRIGADYGLDYYIGLENRALQLAAAYNNRRYAVYSLR